jgi:hypothetical protein
MQSISLPRVERQPFQLAATVLVGQVAIFAGCCVSVAPLGNQFQLGANM